MKRKIFMYTLFFLVSVCLLFSFNLSFAQKKVSEPLVITLEGAKMAPTPFSHKTHVEKVKVDCVVCHHKDKDPKEPESCVKCHPVKDPKDNPYAAKDAFHKMCQTCHKENAAKGVTAPTKCNECHKK